VSDKAIDVGLGPHAQCDDLIAANVKRAEKAEARIAELEAGIRALLDETRPLPPAVSVLSIRLERLLRPALPVKEGGTG